MSNYENIERQVPDPLNTVEPQPPPVERDEGSYWMRCVTIPLVFFYAVGMMSRDNVIQNLILDKVCRYYSSLDEAMCDNQTMNVTVRNILQQDSVLLNMFSQLIQLLPGAFMSLFLGPWIDQYGGRNLMILPIVGNFLGTIVYYLCIQFWPNSPPEMVLVASVPIGLTGAKVIFNMALYKYIANISTKPTKNISFVIADSVMMASIPMASALTGLIFKKAQYAGLFSFSAGFQLLGLFFLFCMPNDYHVRTNSVSPTCNCSTLLSVDSIQQSFYAVFRQRPLNRTRRICLLIGILSLFTLVFQGVDLNIQFFFLANRFNWTMPQYMFFVSWSVGVMSVGSILIIALFSHVFHIADDWIVLIGIFVRVGTLIMFGLSSATWFIYTAGAISFMYGALFSCIRSQLSKLAGSDEEGKLFAVMSSAEACLPVIGIPLFSLIYQGSIGLDPGIIYYTAAAITGLTLILISLHIFYRRKEESQILSTKNELVNNDSQQFSSVL